MALVLRIIDEIPRSPIRRSVTWYVFSKRPQIVSVELTVPKNRFARTPPPAFLFPDQRFQRPRPESLSDRLAPVCGGGGCLNRFDFRVKHFFLKKFSTTSKPSEDRSEGGGYLPIHQLPVNQISQSFSKPTRRKISKTKRQITGPLRADRLDFWGVAARPCQPVRASPSPSEVSI